MIFVLFVAEFVFVIFLAGAAVMHRFIVAGISLLCGALVLAQAEGPTLIPLWDLKGDFAAPESAYYDAASNSVFVSSINGQILDKDGNGYISRLSPDGKVVTAKWVTGLNGPKGLRSVGGTLWVADIDEVVGIEIASGKITSRVKGGRCTVLERPRHGTRRHRVRVRLQPVTHLRGQGRQVLGIRRRR